MLAPNLTKPPKCRYCKKRTEQAGKVIHDDCVAPWWEKFRAKEQAKQKKAAEEKAKAERASDRQRRESHKKLPKLLAETQDAFNEYIRLRDRAKGCFVCGKAFPVGQLGGDFDAGHVRSRGAAGHLRFNEDNCHGECKECNASWGAKPHEIEAGAIRRIGQERFDALKNNNAPEKWIKDEVRAKRDFYRAQVKALRALREEA